MVIDNTKELKEACKVILQAIDTSEPSLISETLELVAQNQTLSMAVTNREYYVVVKMALPSEDTLKATVNALLFLKLISQLMSEQLELLVEGGTLVVKADGTYKLPLIFKDDKLLELPKIELNNVVVEMPITASVLNSILFYNGRELQAAKVTRKPVQKMYYIDNYGAITFTTGACVNSFSLEKPLKLLLSSKVVKLFKLFTGGTVAFALSQDLNLDGSIATKVQFATDSISITAITPSDVQLLESVPVEAIRGMANKTHEHSVVVDRDRLVKALSRLLLFKKEGLSVALKLAFETEHCTLTYCGNQEVLGYQDAQLDDLNYVAHLNIENLKAVVDSCLEDYLTLSFGDHKAVVVARQSIKNIIPELVVV